IIFRVHQLNAVVDKHMQNYDLPNALKPVLDFIDDASNWYVRRSRKRFWKSQNDSEKAQAYQTLHYILVQLSMIMAPFTPFLSEELYRNLTGGESVHLLDWPEGGQINELLIEQMNVVRNLISQGLSQRAEAGIKVRQPLAGAKLTLPFQTTETDQAELADIIKDELNLKSINCRESKQASIVIDVKLTTELKREGMAREIVRYVQRARKQAGLNVDDHINLAIITKDRQLNQATKEHREIISAETLAERLVFDQVFAHETSCEIDAVQLTISIEKA
ncbi:MAG: class I tRNA ligase family protein, partial [Candidatus Saccharimonadales bacterium]